MIKFLVGAVFVGLAFAASPAQASSLTLNATFFSVADSNLDFGNQFPCCGAHVSNEVTNTLVGGLPVANTSPSYTGQALRDVNLSGQLLWWSSPVAAQIGTETFIAPFDTNLFVNSTMNGNDPNGSNQHGLFETAIFTASLTGNTKYTFTYSGDDDVFLAVGDQVINQDGGLHAIGQQNTVSFTTGGGPETLTLFFADRHTVASELSFEVSAVPEPSTWAMMILGFLGMGFIGYRRRSTVFRVA